MCEYKLETARLKVWVTFQRLCLGAHLPLPPFTGLQSSPWEGHVERTQVLIAATIIRGPTY